MQRDYEWMRTTSPGCAAPLVDPLIEIPANAERSVPAAPATGDLTTQPAEAALSNFLTGPTLRGSDIPQPVDLHEERGEPLMDSLPDAEHAMQEDRLDPAQLDLKNTQREDSASSAPADTPQVPLPLKAADSAPPVHPSDSAHVVSESQHKDDKLNRLAATPERRASPQALVIDTSPLSTAKKEDEREETSSPLTLSDGKENPAALAPDANNAANEPLVVHARVLRSQQQLHTPEDRSNSNGDGSDEEQVESQQKGKKRKGRAGSTSAAKRAKTRTAVLKPAAPVAVPVMPMLRC